MLVSLSTPALVLKPARFTACRLPGASSLKAARLPPVLVERELIVQPRKTARVDTSGNLLEALPLSSTTVLYRYTYIGGAPRETQAIYRAACNASVTSCLAGDLSGADPTWPASSGYVCVLDGMASSPACFQASHESTCTHLFQRSIKPYRRLSTARISADLQQPTCTSTCPFLVEPDLYWAWS
jgi:hypothetical protein